ncbi:MAG: UDP-N-acetylmuramoyl-L-alanyl-D-glutamate--2,6-diaminopimelate ligase [Clostridia bacterium]|nr:UDP-N-acetylmuramoyl-L-alanyl-D-glutamate--2,6-diaminopimelate ligase [Clostridia bacterium]
MRLSALLKDVETKTVYTSDCEITGITDNTQKVRRGGVFVCIKGDHEDGHSFARRALDKGAAVIVCERDMGIENSIVVENTRKAYALMCAAFYGNSHKKLRMIGVTGTNGKTTTAYILREILEGSGYKTGLMGTVSVVIGNERYPADLTTPDPADLHRYLMMMCIAGCDTCVMEVSSQALTQYRVYGIEFECGVFTNLSPEHLDYHRTFEEYANAKSVLFENSRTAVLNADDCYSKLMKRSCKGDILTYGIENEADLSASRIQLDRDGVTYSLMTGRGEYPVIFGMTGNFSVYNSMAALAVAYLFNADMSRAVRCVSRIEGIPGRMERIHNKLGINIIIDFAHTPASLENVLKTIRSIYDGRVLTVFGCGGDRDKSKRHQMGETACRLSDKVFVTSDNPRTENPEAIINDITDGLEYTNFYKITDRTLALKSAVSCARAGDTLLVAGKGHEKYQISGTQKIYYNEREIIGKLLEDKARF